MNGKKNYKGLDEFLGVFPEKSKGVIMVSLAGEDCGAPWSKDRCVYWESAVLLVEEGRTIGHTDAHRSRSEIDLVLGDGTMVRVDRNMRLYMEPTWLEEDPSDPSARALLSEARKSCECPEAVLAEFALFPGREYWARIVREEYWLPPDRPDGPPHRARGTTVYISEKPFKDGRPQGPETPMSTWTY